MHSGHEKWLASCSQIGYIPEVQSFPEGTATSKDAASALRCDIGQIAKSILFVCEGQPLLVVTSGKNRVDRKKKLKHLIGKKPSQASPEFVLEHTGYIVGGVPPFGHEQYILTFVDEDLMNYDLLWAAAGSPQTVFPIHPRALLDRTGGTLADIKQTR